MDNHADGPYVYLRLLQEDPERAAEVLELLQMNEGNSSGHGIGCVSWDGEVHADQFWRASQLRQRDGAALQRDLDGHVQSELLAKLKDKKPHVKGRCADVPLARRLRRKLPGPRRGRHGRCLGRRPGLLSDGRGDRADERDRVRSDR
ncbi:MAG: hypothetical protein MZV70_75495 [Desulfobacterales bacterium]|nr:hypothetical protein [Desulfobacterales bacterium]